MAHRMTGEVKPYEQKRSNFQKKVNFVDCPDSSDSDDDQMVGSAEWVQNNKKLVSCPFGNKEPEKYGFDITKADKIFDLLLSEGQIKLKPYHKIPIDQELKNIKYCKWHNATSHDTNECKVFRQQILWQNHLNYPDSMAQAITIKATPAHTHFKRNNSWSVG